MYYEELGQLMGKSKSTAHFWFEIHRNQNLLGFMTLLEHLNSQQRRQFIDSHCRVNPTLEDQSLVVSNPHRTQLLSLLNQTKGLTIVTGGTDAMRTFVFTALGNSYPRAEGRKATMAGIDIHRPRDFVPLLSLKYIDETLSKERIRQLVLKVWPRIITSRTLLLCNGVWSLVPETRTDLVRAPTMRHVILAEKRSADIASIMQSASAPLHVLTVSDAGAPYRIRIKCRRVSAPKA